MEMIQYNDKYIVMKNDEELLDEVSMMKNNEELFEDVDGKDESNDEYNIDHIIHFSCCLYSPPWSSHAPLTWSNALMTPE